MRSEVPTLLSLLEFSAYIGLNPFRVAGYCTNVPENQYAAMTLDDNCNGTWYEYTYQSGLLSRQDIVSAIANAERTFADAIGFWPAPYDIEDEEAKYSQHGLFRQPNGDKKSVTTRYGRINHFGKAVFTLIDDFAGVVLTDPQQLKVRLNGSGAITAIPDTFTATATVPVGTLPEEIEVYFTETDRLSQPRAKWRIHPVEVTIVGTAATIKGRSYQLAPPIKVLANNAACLNAVSDYVEEIEVVRKTYDHDEGHFFWEQSPCNTPRCEGITQNVCFGTRDPKRGIITPTPATWDEETEILSYPSPAVCKPPKHVIVNYTSGYKRAAGGLMDADMASIISKLAAADLNCVSCACNCTRRKLDVWHDYEKTKVGDTSYRVIDVPSNPFGKRYGQAKAWQESRRYRQKY